MRAPLPRLVKLLASVCLPLLALACSSGSPVWCAVALPDAGCSYHVELHCGGGPLCSVGSVQVLDAGACVRDEAADVLDCG